MGKQIFDEYNSLRDKFSRQYIYQLRRKAEGKCIICGEPAVTKRFCLMHQISSYHRHRKYYNSQKQIRCLSQRLQEAQAASLKKQASRKKAAPPTKAKPTTEVRKAKVARATPPAARKGRTAKN